MNASLPLPLETPPLAPDEPQARLRDTCTI